MADGVPRVDELFSRAVVAQLAEQRAQRETFTELERKVERLEALVSTRFSDMSRLLRSGEVELRLEVLEEEFSSRFGRIEKALASAGAEGGLDRLIERLERVEDALRGDDAGRRLTSLELSMAERLGHLEESVRGEDHRARLEVFEREVADRIARLEEIIRTWDPGASVSGLFGTLAERLDALEAQLASGLDRLEVPAGLPPADLVARLEALEGALGERFGHLEETVRTEDVGRRLKSLELAIDERSGRLEELARTSEVERRLEELARSVDERLVALQAAVVTAQGPDPRIEALDQAVAYRLTRLEGVLRRMEEQTATRLEKLAAASTAAEVGILERIIAESQLVAEHFEAVRPLVEAASAAGPDLERALEELRRLARSVPNGETTGSHPVLEMAPDDEGDSAPDELFLPPEETPIPERRFGGLLPRRDR